MGRVRRISPPPNLVVERLDEEFIVLSWDAGVALPPVLTAAERDVLARVVRGESNATIARARKTSVRTTANQVASVLRKTGARSRFDLIRRYGGIRDGSD